MPFNLYKINELNLHALDVLIECAAVDLDNVYVKSGLFMSNFQNFVCLNVQYEKSRLVYDTAKFSFTHC